jgi:hypothetical protein
MIRTSAAVAAALALTCPSGAAASGPVSGAPCAVDAVTWETADPGAWHGALRGGPVVAPGGEPVTLTCTLSVDSWDSSGPAVVSATGPAAPAVGVLPPVPFRVAASEEAWFTVCASATVGSTTWYWGGEGWSTAAGPCPDTSLFSQVPLPPETDPYLRLVGCTFAWGLAECGYELDAALCAPLRGLPPGVPGVVEVREDGDVYVAGEHWWDCQPYEWDGAQK